MSFFSKLVAPYRKGEKNFERARAAELRGDFGSAETYFQTGADAFDTHFAKLRNSDKTARPSHLVMAGICYTRLGRNRDALAALDKALGVKDIPDAFLHAGYAAAKLGDTASAADYWSRYPDWADQPILSGVLKEQATALKQGTSDPTTSCQAVAKGVLRQDRENAKRKITARGSKEVPARKGY